MPELYAKCPYCPEARKVLRELVGHLTRAHVSIEGLVKLAPNSHETQQLNPHHFNIACSACHDSELVLTKEGEEFARAVFRTFPRQLGVPTPMDAAVVKADEDVDF